MLQNNYINFIFKKNIKTGLFVDYISRKIGQYNLKNLFIWGGLYVSEKFIIEYLTRFSSNSQTTARKNQSPLVILTYTILWVLNLLLILVI